MTKHLLRKSGQQQQEQISKNLEVPIEPAVEPVEEEPTPAPEEKPSYVEVAKKAKADPNEIITLRKHQKHSKKRKLETDEDVVSLDLNKKVLGTERHEKKRDFKKKKPKFDPYANVDDSAIKAPKKVNKLRAGKHAVYRKK
ncbi:unnamed protein product [Ambrosiozyma monospora]|uniref:Unnamed protein product n=1 Tax=Ambrosiozyma monospora TaxID=43982 RepID=A0ACB5TCF1_AMBMO|nr:unnamed protein product [Ambrosiozyma monospora]